MIGRKHGCRTGGSAQQAGFSLIELMVVVGVIGILAAIALPSYNEHIRKTRRAAGGACATAAAQQMERYYTTALTYVDSPDGAELDDICDPETLDYYSIGTANVAARTYTVTATPRGAQDGDSCGVLSITQAGVKSPATDGCW